jgi:hypothetical protein
MRIYREKGDAAGPLTVRKGCRRAPCHCRSERVRSTVRERRCRGAAPRRPRWADARRRRCCGAAVGACEGEEAGDAGLRRSGRDGQRRAHATEESVGGGATANWGWPRRGEGAGGAVVRWGRIGGSAVCIGGSRQLPCFFFFSRRALSLDQVAWKGTGKNPLKLNLFYSFV